PFWAHAAYIGNSMNSRALPDGANSGKETAFTLDLYHPFDPEFLLGFGMGFHSYDDKTGFFSVALQNATDIGLALLGTTLQGLPKLTFSLQATWQLAPRDAFLPRYQATELEKSSQWVHTIDLGWRHQFAKQWFFTPTYEATVQGSQTFTGFIID